MPMEVDADPDLVFEMLGLIQNIKRRVLVDLNLYPGSTAAEVACRIGEENPRLVLGVLKDAQREGKCRSHRVERYEGVFGPYLWEVTCPMPT